MNRIALIGGGGHVKVVISVLRALGWTAAAIFDDDVAKRGRSLLDVPVVGPLEAIKVPEFDGGVIAVGNNSTRAKIATRIAMPWITAVHPNAFVHPSVQIGEGTVVFAGAIIQPDTVIGQHVIVNTDATIDHDCKIGDYVHLAPGVHLAGDVHVGRSSFVGIGSVAIPGIRIGSDCVVGAGSAIVANIPDASVSYGVPAKVRKPNPNS